MCEVQIIRNKCVNRLNLQSIMNASFMESEKLPKVLKRKKELNGIMGIMGGIANRELFSLLFAHCYFYESAIVKPAIFKTSLNLL